MALGLARLLREELDIRSGMRPHERLATATYLILDATRAGGAADAPPPGSPTSGPLEDDR